MSLIEKHASCSDTLTSRMPDFAASTFIKNTWDSCVMDRENSCLFLQL